MDGHIICVESVHLFEQSTESVQSGQEVQSRDECEPAVYDWHRRLAQRLQCSRRRGW